MTIFSFMNENYCEFSSSCFFTHFIKYVTWYHLFCFNFFKKNELIFRENQNNLFTTHINNHHYFYCFSAIFHCKRVMSISTVVFFTQSIQLQSIFPFLFCYNENKIDLNSILKFSLSFFILVRNGNQVKSVRKFDLVKKVFLTHCVM